MKVTYDPETDALVITLRSAQPHGGRDLAPGFIGHYDAEGNLLELEVLDASKRLDDPMTITLELLAEPAAV
jgi:uncharacterized protein YuzE